MQTSAPVQLIVVSSPTQTNSGEQSVATPPRQSPAVINPNSLAAVVKELRDAALANNNIELMIDEIETEYQRRLALRCAEGLQLPPFTIGVTSPIITHSLNSGVGSQHMQPNGSRSVQTSVAPSHPALVSLTNVGGVGHCSQGGSTQISNPVESMHLDLELERAHTASLESKLQSSNLEMQSMKNMMESMAQNMQAMQNMMINNGGTHMVDQSPEEKEKSKKQGQKRSSTDSVDSDSPKHSFASHESKKLRKKTRVKVVSSSSSSSESEFESGSLSDAISVDSSRVSRTGRQYDRDPRFPNFTGKESWCTWYTGFDDVANRKGWDSEKCLDMLLPKLQGMAGDFVFDELNPKEHANYKTLIKCLKHRFHKVESTKTYVVKFWKRNQKASETEETYAADLKCIYGKAYPQRDNSA